MGRLYCNQICHDSRRSFFRLLFVLHVGNQPWLLFFWLWAFIWLSEVLIDLLLCFQKLIHVIFHILHRLSGIHILLIPWSFRMNEVIRVHLLIHLSLHSFKVILIQSMMFFVNKLLKKWCELCHERVCQVIEVQSCFLFMCTNNKHGIPYNFNLRLSAKVKLWRHSCIKCRVSLNIFYWCKPIRPCLKQSIINYIGKLFCSEWNDNIQSTKN